MKAKEIFGTLNINTAIGRFDLVNKEYISQSKSRQGMFYRTFINNVDVRPNQQVMSLYEAYRRPSDFKERIYEECLDACKEISSKISNGYIDRFGVYSYNCMQFSFVAWDGDYIYYITKTKNLVIPRYYEGSNKVFNWIDDSVEAPNLLKK